MFRRDDGGRCWSLRLHACQGRAMTLPLFPRAALPANKPLPEPSCFRLWSRCPREVLLRVTSTDMTPSCPQAENCGVWAEGVL